MMLAARKAAMRGRVAVLAAYLLVLHAIVLSFASALYAAPSGADLVHVICTPDGAVARALDDGGKTHHGGHGTECCLQTCTPLQPALDPGPALDWLTPPRAILPSACGNEAGPPTLLGLRSASPRAPPALL